MQEEVSFGIWLRKQRRALDLTRQAFADQVGCAEVTLRRIEAGTLKPSKELANLLLEKLGIPELERSQWISFARGLASFPALLHPSPNKPNTNLPAPLTTFIGREKEQEEVILLLRKNRLVTFAGAGGMGKTRLAIQVGHRLLRDYPDGVWFVPLDSLSDPLLVPQTVASVFDVREGADQPVIETLKNVLRRKTLLLILDNCEHLLDACAQLITALLLHCPNLRILTTSREILNMEGEATYYLPSLSTPEIGASPDTLSEYESIRLFVERATLAQAMFQLTKENVQAIVEICRRVDGIPLAIELTAARVNILKVEEISKQLHKSFAILISDQRTALPRHQTLQASIDWSWSLLTDVEQVFLCQLSVFAGGWTLEAAESVCDGNTLNLTNTLVQKSLIKVKQETEHETRYYFHEMVRQYAREKLLEVGGAGTIRDRHLAYFVKLVEQAEPELYRSSQIYWFDKLDQELENFRMALEWALATDVESGLRIATIPWRFWQRRDYQELGDWTSQLLERYPKSDSWRAQALAGYSTYLFVRGNFADARKIAEQALQLARALSDQQNEALSLLFLGRIIVFPGGYHEGLPLLEQSLALYQSLGNKIGQATATAWLGINHNDLKHSKSLLLESLKLHRELGNLSGIAWCLTYLAHRAILGGDLSSPGPWLEEAKTLYHELRDRPSEADILETFGILAHWRGDYQQAYTYFEQAITLYEKVGGSWSSWPRVRMAHTLLLEGDLVRAREMFEITIQQFWQDNSVNGVIYTIEGFASLHATQGRPERAVRLFAWANAMREEIGDHRPPIEQVDVDKSITACLAKMGEVAFSDSYEEGKKMSRDEAVAYALEET